MSKNGRRMKMNHQKLECYQRMLRMVKEVQVLMPNLARGTAEIEDQLKRALNSAVLNTVEGNGRRTPKDRRCFFNRATASLAEASACFDLLAIYQPKFSQVLDRQKRELGIALSWNMSLLMRDLTVKGIGTMSQCLTWELPETRP